MNLEEKDRQVIDVQLAAAGDVVQTKDTRNHTVIRGVAVHKHSFATFSTDYAAQNDFILWEKEAILYKILDRWNEANRRFSKERWLKSIVWI